MTYYLLFLICGFFAGVMFEKNRIIKKLLRDAEGLRHELLAESIKRLAAMTLSGRKNSFTGILAQLRYLLAAIAIPLLVGCVLPTGSPIGYVPPVIPQQPVSFYIPPVAMDFTTGQWQAPPSEPFTPRTPIPRQASGMIGNQYFSTLY